jgi:hypothetical protein
MMAAQIQRGAKLARRIGDLERTGLPERFGNVASQIIALGYDSALVRPQRAVQ